MSRATLAPGALWGRVDSPGPSQMCLGISWPQPRDRAARWYASMCGVWLHGSSQVILSLPGLCSHLDSTSSAVQSDVLQLRVLKTNYRLFPILLHVLGSFECPAPHRTQSWLQTPLACLQRRLPLILGSRVGLSSPAISRVALVAGVAGHTDAQPRVYCPFSFFSVAVQPASSAPSSHLCISFYTLPWAGA